MLDTGFYTTPGPLTQIEAPEIARIKDYRTIVAAARGLAVHELNADRYPLPIPADREEVVQLRPASALLQRIHELDERPVDQARPVTRRLVTFCRPLAVLGVGLLRAAGLPARARCGFAAPDGDGTQFFDHWWIECFDQSTRRWVTVDTGRDPEVQQLTYDPDDIPAGRCVSGPAAWRLCRSGEVDPNRFGVDIHWGAWFVRGNVIRDLAALHKIEMLPWDMWGPMDVGTPLGAHRLDDVIDQIAVAEGVNDWETVAAIYATHEELHPPSCLVAETQGSYPDLADLVGQSAIAEAENSDARLAE
jgi:hypothetical protein